MPDELQWMHPEFAPECLNSGCRAPPMPQCDSACCHCRARGDQSAWPCGLFPSSASFSPPSLSGRIPPWLQGTLLRNGPGMHTVGDSRYNHWFDGLALLHSFTIRDGEVYYRSKYLKSDTYNANVEANRIVVSEFGTMAYPDPCKNIFSKAFSYLSHTIPDFTDNCLINIMRCGEDFYATTETNYMRRINPQTLETLEKTHIHIIDQRTRKPVPTRFYTDAMVVFHHVNAYEEGGCIVFDVITYKDSSLYDLFYLANLNQDFEENSRLTSVPTLRRFAVPLHVDGNAEVGTNLIKVASTTATALKERDDQVYCQPELLLEGLELPQINYTHNGKPYRYVFAAGVQWSPIPTQILKYDTLTKSSLRWGEESCWPAEPLFVPAPGAKDEDDGVILSAIVSTDPQKLPFLLILDAKSFTELARASLAVEMHLDLHGLFIPDADGAARNQATSETEQAPASGCQGPHRPDGAGGLGLP
ncbi:beta,beta-carotene 15,15'-dioxygenase isoform X6 [Heterocephalus glaber]|uniref:Beta,beta-carotene 15,15'-dioxygenase isoform X6 n=1 Tax=Heterocephalus glaber TaxID=10181 RepID=A0AAX6SX64_HETGA|nr:beta,beta-carotene 15,15'-dioxygenase isoform X6 [Heterocephalus glaber]